jgi:hypothetical protein
MSEEQAIEAGEESSVEGEAVEASTEGESLEAQIEDAKENGASKEEIKNMIKDYQLKVNGKVINRKIDLSDDQAIIRELQLAEAGKRAMSESAELKKLFKTQLEEWKNDPWKLMQDLGLDPDEAAELRLRQKVEELKKSPEQIQREQMQRDLEDLRAKLKAKEDQELESKKNAAYQQAIQELDVEIVEALKSHTSLPNSSRVHKQIADTMLWAMDNGFENVKVEDVLPTVEKELRKEIEELASQLPEEMLEAYFGKKNVDRVMKKVVASKPKIPAKVPSLNDVKPGVSKQIQEDKPRPKVRVEDFMRMR